MQQAAPWLRVKAALCTEVARQFCYRSFQRCARCHHNWSGHGSSKSLFLVICTAVVCVQAAWQAQVLGLWQHPVGVPAASACLCTLARLEWLLEVQNWQAPKGCLLAGQKAVAWPVHANSLHWQHSVGQASGEVT